jgi:hypothetical protein
MNRILATLFSALAFAGLLAAQDTKPTKPAEPTKVEAPKFAKTDGYPLDVCIVTDETLDESAKTFAVDGNTFKACCRKCQGKVTKDPKTYTAKLEEAVIKAQSANYPLTNCPVSGKALDDKAVSMVVSNTLVKLCCGNCKEKATSDAANVTAKVQAAAFAKQSAAYTAKTCPVSGHELDGSAISVMHGNTLVKLCCEDCKAKLNEAPNAMAAKVAPKVEAKPETKGDVKKASTPAAPGGKDAPMAAAVGATDMTCEAGSADGAGCCMQNAAKAEAKSECCEGEKAAAKVDVKADAKTVATPTPGKNMPAAAAGCCIQNAAKTEAKAECCESQAKAEKAECCEAGKAAAKVEVKADVKPAAKKLN